MGRKPRGFFERVDGIGWTIQSIVVDSKVVGDFAIRGISRVRAVKECVLKNLRLPLKEAFELELDYSAKVFMTEDAQEGLAAFREKRPAIWKGK